MDKTLTVSFIYGICAVISLLLAGGYFSLVRKKENWLVWLYFSVFIANLGYFTLSISRTLEEALLANRLAYLGCVFLPLFMLMTIMNVCHMEISKIFTWILITISAVVFLVAASQGYLDLYYRDVSLLFVNGSAKLVKIYGPLHSLYYIYLFTYFALMIGTILYATVCKKVFSRMHAGLLAVVVLMNIAIWLVEQFVEWNFEFLAISYIASEMLLLFLYGMIQEYEFALEQYAGHEPQQSDVPKMGIERVMEVFPEAVTLSNREKDVLTKMLENKKRKEIAEELFITENTVKKHVSNIFAKLQVGSREEMYMKIVRQGKSDS